MKYILKLLVAVSLFGVAPFTFADAGLPKAPTMQLLQGVKLTPEQQVALKGVFKDKKEALKAKERALKDATLEVKRALNVIDAQDDGIRSVVEKQKVALQELAFERMALLRDLASKLTDEQKETFQAILSSMMHGIEKKDASA